MDDIIKLLIGDLILTPEYLFLARCLSLCLVVDVLSALISSIVTVAKSVR